MKFLVRRIAVGVAIISFLLPWFEDFFKDITGFSLMINSLGIGSDFNVPELIAAGVTILMIFVTAIWTFIQPKRLPTILFLVPSTLILIGAFVDQDLSSLRLYGMSVFLIGVIGVYVSLFLKAEGIQQMVSSVVSVNQPSNEVAATVGETIVRTTNVTSSANKFCSNCGNELNIGNKFCKNCGSETILNKSQN